MGKAKDKKCKTDKWNRAIKLTKRIFINKIIAENIITNNSLTIKTNENSDIIKDMPILELRIGLIINHVFNKYNSEIEDIVEDTKQKISEKLK